MKYQTVTAVIMAGLFAASAFAQSPKYDGTGSIGTYTPDAKISAIAQAATAERQKLFDQKHTKAESGDREAMFDLGAMWHQGYVDDVVDLKAAFDLYEAAADKGEVRALAVMCPAYLLGINRPVNVAKAMQDYCDKLKPEHPTFLFAGGYDYDHGVSGPKDEKEALKLYYVAAKAGSGDAMNAVGQKLRHEPGKASVARNWFLNAAREGAADGMFNLANMAMAGEGASKDEKLAGWLYANAAKRGHKGALAWLADQPVPLKPLMRVSAYGRMTEDIESPNGRPTRPFDFNNYANLLSQVPLLEDEERVVTVHCYINAGRTVELCLVQGETPSGHNLGTVMQSTLSQNLTVSRIDKDGRPTSHGVFAIRYRWPRR